LSLIGLLNEVNIGNPHPHEQPNIYTATFLCLFHTLILTPERRGEGKMIKMDYDRALYYTHRSEWDNLLILMVRTSDNFLEKKIEHFLHAYNFEKDYAIIEKKLYSLLRYIDHANTLNEGEVTDNKFQMLH
jgi:hypothetical protein